MRKCLEAAKLLSLPVRGGKTPTHSSAPAADTEHWDAWADDAGNDPLAGIPARNPAKETATRDARPDAAAAADPGLWDVESRLFADNQSARRVLEDLGLELLDEKEARRLLRLRVELAG